MNYLHRLPRPDCAAGHEIPSRAAGKGRRPIIFEDGISLQRCIKALRLITELLNERGRNPRRFAILRRTLHHLEELARCPIYDSARGLPQPLMK